MQAPRLLSWSLPAAAVLACGAYWTQLLHTQEQARERALANAAARAVHLADTLALQAETLLQSADFVLSTVGAQWQERQPLPPLPYPPGAVLQLGVLDGKGRLQSVDGSVARVVIDGLPAPGPGLSIGAPARQPVAGAVSFVRPLPGQGQVLLTLSPSYLTGLLRRLQPSRGDLLLLARADSVAVARSDGLVEPLPFPVAPLFERAPRAGEVVTQSWPSEEGRRILGWQRAGSTPLLALAAVDEASALRGVQAEQAAVRRRAALGSAALLALVAGVIALSQRWQRRRASARQPASA
ncbi:hypothetical protein [Azohydromonas caseinilytica]|uniref:Uncharacterized protein n=1 Tax=Azohydromonas caseinilytica TaxID=2728836 RepID=A0A848F1H6_9BURK|nr:hypothetical protein [Azohydromonas caseinilytica]NML13927.1 hypothetical protein [Azohydromonas caseinilytica]